MMTNVNSISDSNILWENHLGPYTQTVATYDSLSQIRLLSIVEKSLNNVQEALDKLEKDQQELLVQQVSLNKKNIEESSSLIKFIFNKKKIKLLNHQTEMTKEQTDTKTKQLNSFSKYKSTLSEIYNLMIMKPTTVTLSISDNNIIAKCYTKTFFSSNDEKEMLTL